MHVIIMITERTGRWQQLKAYSTNVTKNLTFFSPLATEQIELALADI